MSSFFKLSLFIFSILLIGCNALPQNTTVPNNPLTTQNSVFLKAKGDSPLWTADIENNQLFFSNTKYARSLTELTSRANYASGVSYSGNWQGYALVLNVTKQDCEDKSGRNYQYTAQAMLDDQVYSGCASL
ncbi:hypothetical protein VQ643_00290 [Pseudomonas sp. F1_0610]|uniref:hypothetical protein n=1 Tax=Pseudomonas sp. F1_0610 TaxID=3114284 RepID=UPI0039C22714